MDIKEAKKAFEGALLGFKFLQEQVIKGLIGKQMKYEYILKNVEEIHNQETQIGMLGFELKFENIAQNRVSVIQKQDTNYYTVDGFKAEFVLKFESIDIYCTYVAREEDMEGLTINEIIKIMK